MITLYLILCSTKAGPSLLMGNVMEKLTDDIKTNSDILSKNPVLALGLKRGYSNSDVKKQYRLLALKYHPGISLVFLCK
jgi:preprotein translocase subunit Sec63